MTKKKVMTIEEYCLKEGKQTLLQNFMLDINSDPSKNMCCADSAICSRYSDTTFLFNFKCHICNTEWEGSGYSYIVKELTCPTCNKDSTHQKIKYASVKKGSLTLLDWCTGNEERGKQIQSEWTGISEDGNHYTMDEVAFGSGLKMLWRCKDGHEWYAIIYIRTNGHGCPECYNKNRSEFVRKTKTNSENSLSTWCLNNTEIGRIITSQWTGISESGKHYTMAEVAYASGLKMLWRDEYNHEWYAIISSRTQGEGCPYCNKIGTSYPEQFIYWSLKQLYPNTQNRYKAFKDIDSRGIELDVYVKELNLAIEYSPTYWHGDRKEKDEYKKQLCEQNSVKFIQIIEDSNNEYKEEVYTENYICISALTPSNRDDYLQKIVSYILSTINHSINEIDIELVKKNALTYSKKKIEYEKSVEFIYTTLAAEFHPTLNTIKPSEITTNSKIKIKFLCANCNYGVNGEYEATISNKVNHKSGCPRCGFNWFDEEIYTNAIKIVTEGVNDLQSQHPELAKEIHPTLTNINPSKIKVGSNIKIDWLCPYCDYTWKAMVYSRVAQKSGCRRCGYNWHKAETNQPQNIKSQYRKSATPSKPKPFKYVKLSDIDKEMQSWDF